MSRTFAAIARAAAGLATGRLGWSPEAFWRATPADLGLALSNPDAAAGAALPLSRGELQRMMERTDHDR
ncbi:MAG: phage tail assembly chaperone [Sphingomonadaceae bacterium]